MTLPRQLLIGHCDTVWPVGTVSRMPVRVEGDAFQGPGVFDMKGGLVQMIFALRALQAFGFRPPAESVVADQLGRRDRQSRLHPSHPAPGPRAGRAFVLEPAYGRSGKLKTARKASGGFTVIVKGRAAHAGINPEEGRQRHPRDVAPGPATLRAQRRGAGDHRERGDDRRRAPIERGRPGGAGHRGRAGPDAARTPPRSWPRSAACARSTRGRRSGSRGGSSSRRWSRCRATRRCGGWRASWGSGWGWSSIRPRSGRLRRQHDESVHRHARRAGGGRRRGPLGPRARADLPDGGALRLLVLLLLAPLTRDGRDAGGPGHAGAMPPAEQP